MVAQPVCAVVGGGALAPTEGHSSTSSRAGGGAPEILCFSRGASTSGHLTGGGNRPGPRGGALRWGQLVEPIAEDSRILSPCPGDSVSLRRPDELPCRVCGAMLHVERYESVNARRHPYVRDAILAGGLHTADCACGARTAADWAFGYLDPDRRHYVAVAPFDAETEGDAWESAGRSGFWDASRLGPPGWIDVATTFTVRVVFGVDALAEKLRVWDAGLDDALVELLKRQLHRDRELTAETRLVLMHVDAAGLELAEVGADGVSGVRVDRDRYEALQRRRSAWQDHHPSLFFGQWVSWRRLETTSREPP